MVFDTEGGEEMLGWEGDVRMRFEDVDSSFRMK